MKIDRLVLGSLETNCYILEKCNDVIIIDPADSINLILEKIKNRNLKGILVTHHHFDHIGALDELEKKYNLKHNNFNIDNFEFEVIKTPGHTDDLISFYFPKEKILFCGDFLFKGSIGRFDFENSSYIDMVESLKLISKYPDDIIVYPGHGDKTILGDEKRHFSILF